ncbi:MAG: transcription elongation factor GreA [Gammaproteobacteria bacterium]
MTRYPMTLEGANQLRDELQRLKSVERPKVIAAIAEARGHGDLKENAEYHAAREHQGFIEGRIAEIEGKLGQSHVIDVTKIPQTGTVVFGTTVVLFNLETDEKVIYKIVGDDEADFKLGKISINSPIARALIGKKESDVVEVNAPGGNIEYEISEVQYR